MVNLKTKEIDIRFPTLTIAVPALNEERQIANTLNAIKSAASKFNDKMLEIIVIDDGSTDRTGIIVSELFDSISGLKLITNEVNLGLGASIRKAINSAKSNRFMIVPGDNDIPKETLELLFKNIDAADLVMTYFHNDECRGRGRYLLSEAFRLIYTTTFNLYVMYINGPAVYPTKLLREIKLKSTRFSIVAELNVKILRQGISFVEIPSSRQIGSIGSTAVTLRNLAETISVFFHLVAEICFINKSKYAKYPFRKYLTTN